MAMTIDYEVRIHYTRQAAEPYGVPSKWSNWSLHLSAADDSHSRAKMRHIECVLEKRRVTFNGQGGEAYKWELYT